MKELLLILVLASSFNSSSQHTNAEVYNFQIGDVFQVHMYGGSPDYVRHLDSIIDKIISTDTITYIYKRTTGHYGPPPLPSFDAVIDTLVIIDLNSVASHINHTSCLPPTDDIIAGNCGEVVNRRLSAWDSTCFEPPIWNSELHSGLGGPYYSIYDVANSIDYNKTLEYSNTFQFGECGTLFNMPYVGVEEMKLTQTRKLLRITDLLGRESNIKSSTILLYIYSDGTTERKFIVEP